jgi:hypothetical protein
MDGTSTIDVVIATATAAANGQNIGDISIILPEGLADTLTTSIETAISACGDVVEKVRRDGANVRRQADASETISKCDFMDATELTLYSFELRISIC